MAKIKVLAISYLFPNTSQPNHGIFVYNRLNALSKIVDIKVINPIPWSPIHRWLSQYSNLADIPYRTQRGNLEIYHPRYFSIPRFFKSLESLTFEKSISRVLEKDLCSFDFDIIDLHWTFPDLPAGSALSRKYGKPFMVTVRGMEAFYLEEAGLRKSIIKHYLGQARKIITMSEHLKQKSIDLGVSADKHFIIQNGVDTEIFKYIDRIEARKNLGIGNSEIIILSIGRLVKPKGFDLIIEALPQVIERTGCRDIKLYIIGAPDPGDDFRGALYKQIKRLGLQNNVVFQGTVQNEFLPYWYNAADLFCLASRGEGSPNVLIEALACGCPSVATDVGAVKEIIESEPNQGICVPNDQVAPLGLALVKILQSNFDRAQNARIYSRYDWDWCAENVNQVYQQVVTS